MIDELLSKDEAETLLAPHLGALRGFVEQGWTDWHDLVKSSPKLATSRRVSRANIVYDGIVQPAEQYFDALNIPTSWKNQFLTVVLGDGRLVVRFKKFQSKKLRTSGVPTQQRLEFEWQQVVLDGTASTYIVVGYLPDELEIGLDVIAIACSFGGVLKWHIDLRDDGTGTVAVPLKTIKPAGPSVRSTRPASRKKSEEG